MTPLDVAYRLFGGKFNSKGKEIVPDLCPFCQGGAHHDKYTFAINMDTGAYNCKRGNCGQQGSIKQLKEYFRIESGPNYEIRKPASNKVYKKPETVTQPPTAAIERYLTARKFKKETWERRGVGQSEGKISFPYYENGELVAVKFRGPSGKGKYKNFSMEAGGKLVFWGMDLCDFDMPLIITEGELDAMSLDEVGIPNAVSIPNGAESLGCIDLCWDWLQRFKQYYIWTDSDEPGLRCRTELVKRLGVAKCKIVFSSRKDANEVLFYDGPDGVAECLSNAQYVPIDNLYSLADLPDYDPESDITIKSSIAPMHFRMGEISVWTGINLSGKSTMLSQELLSAIDQGFKVCAYSGELADRLFRYWVDRQAAGPDGVEVLERDERTIYRVKTNTINRIRAWYADKFFLYNSLEIISQQKLFEVWEYAYQRYGCNVFSVDNLMALGLGAGAEKDFLRKQAEFVGMCKKFATDWKVHIHIVAHPRKPARGQDIDKMDIAGLAEITNWADNVYKAKRYGKKEMETIREDPTMYGVTGSLEIQKGRFEGRQEDVTMLCYESKSMRFYAPGSSPNWQLGWAEDSVDVWSDIAREVK